LAWRPPPGKSLADQMAREGTGTGKILALQPWAAVSLEELAETAKLRWRVERDYQELKQGICLGHFEGRGWRGVNNHASPCIAVYEFLVAERSSFPPLAPTSGQTLRYIKYPKVGSRGDPSLRLERHSPWPMAVGCSWGYIKYPKVGSRGDPSLRLERHSPWPMAVGCSWGENYS
jgi:hypothetical protein